MKYPSLFAFVCLAFAPLSLTAKVEIRPPDARAVKSESYRVEAAGREVFTAKFRTINFASFSVEGPNPVTVHAPAPIRSFNISPHAAGIVAHADGSTLTFTLDRPRHLVVTVNDGEKLFLFANPIETAPPRPGAAGVTSILDFGVDPTGGKIGTVRIQQAIDQVAAAQGTLYFPPGVYLTGTLSLKSNLTLYLAEGARLLGSDNPDDYPLEAGADETLVDGTNSHEEWARAGRVDVAYRRLILIDGAQHVRVAGRGIIDGRGKLLRFKKNIIFVGIYRSSDIVFEDVTLLDSPLYNIHPMASENLIFRNLKIVSDQDVPNTDGIDPDSCKDVLIDGCFFLTTDDCVSPKASKHGGMTGDLVHLVVRNCVFLSRTTPVKFGNESFGGVQRDITFENNDMVEGDRAIVISCRDDYGYEDIRFINNRIERLLPLKNQFPVHVHVRQRVPGGPAGWIHNVLFQDLIVEEEYENPSKLTGFSSDHDVRGIHFVNYMVAGKVRLNADDAKVLIGPFVSDVTFSRTPE